MNKHKTKLSQHILTKGKFVTPLNSAFNGNLELQSWSNTRLPEYFWIGLILNYYGRKKSINIIPTILQKINQIDNNIISPLFSKILNLPDNKQEELYTFIKTIINVDVFAPLTLLFTYSEYPIFSRNFCNINIKLGERKKVLEEVLQKCYHPQTEFSTDIKYWAIFMLVKQHKLIINSTCTETINSLQEYMLTPHEDEKMKIYRPFIRTLEVSASRLVSDEGINTSYISKFWEGISTMSDCILYALNYEKKNDTSERYVRLLHEILCYLTNLYTSSMPLDKRTITILGMYTCAYKRILEVVEGNLYNTLSGRSSIRNLIEIYIMLKYLFKKEGENDEIWNEFQNYGIGQLKTIVTRFRDIKPQERNHIDCNLLETLVNDYKQEEFLDMDISHFDKLCFREKAQAVNESELYALYDYDSIYEHGLWGAIRESCMLNCNNPAHQYHCVPDCENAQNLKSIWADCIFIMNKILNLINIYYEIPEILLNEANNIEKNNID